MMQKDSWKWQVKESIRSIEKLDEYLHLNGEEKQGVLLAESEFNWHITPYYASLMKTKTNNCPIRKQAVPQKLELHDNFGVMDPLEEERHNPAPNII